MHSTPHVKRQDNSTQSVLSTLTQVPRIKLRLLSQQPPDWHSLASLKDSQNHRSQVESEVQKALYKAYIIRIKIKVGKEEDWNPPG